MWYDGRDEAEILGALETVGELKNEPKHEGYAVPGSELPQYRR